MGFNQCYISSIENLQLEVILVDNNCSDNTAKVAIEVWSKFGNPFCLSILTEPTPGLSYARKKGVLSAKGEIIVFCDDDNWLNENYLSMGFKYIDTTSNIFSANILDLLFKLEEFEFAYH